MKSILFVDEDYQLWNYSNESFQISLLLPRIPSHLEIAVKRTNLMETSGSNRGRSKIKPPIKIFVKRKKDRYCRRGVAKILEEKTIPRFLFDILHHQGKLDLSCDNTLFTVQAIDPFEKTNPLRFEKNVNSRHWFSL